MPGEDSASLVERARDPAAPIHLQQAAFTRLLERWQGSALGLALSSLGDMDDAKDAVQEAFVTAWLRLGQLRDPSAFHGWLKTMVVRQCARRRRRRMERAKAGDFPGFIAPDTGGVDYEATVGSALAGLPESEREVTLLYYFLGHSQADIARLLRLKPGTVGKRLHSARLRIRRRLPPSVRREFVRVSPSQPFTEKVRRGLLDEYTGDYRFENRPDHVVTIVREGSALFGEAGGQRHLLVPGPGGEGSLLAGRYDGEGRFRRNRQGKVTHFVYYEFGKRLGVARKAGVS